MKWIVFQEHEEKALNFIQSLPTDYWYSNKDRFFRKEHNCSLLLKIEDAVFKFILTSTSEDFTSYIESHLQQLYIDFQLVNELEDTTDYEFIISKEIDNNYVIALNQQLGSYRVDKIQKKYLGAHIERLKDKLANVFERITKYEFDFSIMIATSYLDELISELFKHTFELDRFAKFDQNTKTSVTLNFKIEYLYAKGIIDAKTNDTLSLLRKIRNTLAHQSVIEEKEEKSIDSRIVEIKKICDNGILSRPETIQGITDSRLLVLVPVIENLCLAFINAIHFSNPLIKLGNILYANKGYGTGFIYTTVPEYISERVLHHLEHKYHSLKLDSETYHRHGIQVNF